MSKREKKKLTWGSVADTLIKNKGVNVFLWGLNKSTLGKSWGDMDIWRSNSKEIAWTEAASITVWTWFGFKKWDMERNTIIYTLCRVTFVADRIKKTLFYNIKTKHAEEYKEFSALHFSSNKRSFHSCVKREGLMQTSLRESLTSHCPIPRWYFHLHHQFNGFPSVQDKSCAVLMCTWLTGFNRTVRKSSPPLMSLSSSFGLPG